MELYQLGYFVEVARQQNFTRASERLHIAQPALSQQIQKLELELGTALFLRGRKKTALTPAGEALLPRALNLLAMAESARQAIADISGLKGGSLVVATIPTLSACWFPDIVKRFRADYPHIELSFQEDSSEGVAEWVENSDAELGFIQLPVNRELFDVRELMTETFFVLLPKGHALESRKFIKLGELSKESFIFYKGKVRSLTLEACRHEGFEPRIACESTELDTVRALVQAGLGIAVLPEMSVKTPLEHAKALPLRKPKLERGLGMISRKGRPWSAAAKAFAGSCGCAPAV